MAITFSRLRRNFVRRSTPLVTWRRQRRGEAALPTEEASDRLAGQMSQEAQADGFARVLNRHNHALLATKALVKSQADKVASVRSARDTARLAAENHRQAGFGHNHVAPPVWTVLVPLVFSLEWVLGRFVVALLAAEESDQAVFYATAAVASVIYLVGHMAGTAIRTWIDAGDESSIDQVARRTAWAMAAFVVAYLGIVALFMVAAEADLGRWVMSYAAVFGSVVLQVLRPHRSVWQYGFELIRLCRLSPLHALHSRRGLRAGKKLAKDFHKVTAYWASHMSYLQAALAQTGRDHTEPREELVENHQRFLETIGLKVTSDDVAEAIDNLAAAGLDVGAVIPILRKVI